MDASNIKQEDASPYTKHPKLGTLLLTFNLRPAP